MKLPLLGWTKRWRPGFEGGVFDGQLGADHAVGLLDAQHVHGANAEGLEPEVATGLDNGVENVVLALHGVVQFPAQLADEVDPGRPRRGLADGDFLGGQPGERSARQIGVGDAAHEVAGLGPGDHQHAQRIGQVLNCTEPSVGMCLVSQSWSRRW